MVSEEMHESPLVSVVLTTYNRLELLKKTICSILNQTLNNFELIIVDNFSDYDFFRFISTFNDKRIKAYQNRNKGVIAINRNFGIEQSSGKYIAFCDDDDLWKRDKLKDQLEYIVKFNVDMVFSICKMFGNVNFLSSLYGIYPLPYNVKLSRDKLLEKNFISLGTTLIKKKVIKKFSGFDESDFFYGIEDYELWLRLINRINIVFIPRIHTFYRIHSNMTQLNNPERENGMKMLYQRYNIVYKRKPLMKIYLKIFRNIIHMLFEMLLIIRFFELKIFSKYFIKTRE